ncbi:hypothetical protein TNCV_2559241 [Trichonephila clavipes]|nr:hypothetical protein TNCV_2559241 [Trichonephila clavipes]
MLTLGLYYIIICKSSFVQNFLEWTKHVEFTRGEVWAVKGMLKNLPAHSRLQCFAHHRNTRTSIIMQDDNPTGQLIASAVLDILSQFMNGAQCMAALIFESLRGIHNTNDDFYWALMLLYTHLMESDDIVCIPSTLRSLWWHLSLQIVELLQQSHFHLGDSI